VVEEERLIMICGSGGGGGLGREGQVDPLFMVD
jgi:hypothetical protein